MEAMEKLSSLWNPETIGSLAKEVADEAAGRWFQVPRRVLHQHR